MAVIGAGYSVLLWKTKPDVFATMGRTQLAEAHERDAEPAVEASTTA